MNFIVHNVEKQKHISANYPRCLITGICFIYFIVCCSYMICAIICCRLLVCIAISSRHWNCVWEFLVSSADHWIICYHILVCISISSAPKTSGSYSFDRYIACLLSVVCLLLYHRIPSRIIRSRCNILGIGVYVYATTNSPIFFR